MSPILRPGSPTNQSEASPALAFFITFSTYASHLHGDPRGSVDRHHNVPGREYRPPSAALAAWITERLKSPPLLGLSAPQRESCHRAIEEVCEYRGWTLRALNVRTNHVHVVVSADAVPEIVMRDFKAYGTRALRRAGLVEETQRVWTQHGSIRRLLSADAVMKACADVVERQGTRQGMVGDVE